jgi:hypothetical protein
MKIYIVAYEDYDGSDSVGYFLDESKANECCKYLDRARPSCYSESGYTWDVYEYELDETDYASLNKELDEQERIEFETRLEREKQEALAEIERLKAKYGF